MRHHIIKAEQRLVMDLLNEWDFIGVGQDLPQNPDEYECLTAPLLQRLSAGAGPAELAAYLDHELPEHSGLDLRTCRTDWFAPRLHTSWMEHAAR